MTKRAALYVRVSTDMQTCVNQTGELATVAKARGWEIVATYEDAGISGAKGRDKRPGLDAMLKDAQAGKFAIVMAWSIDRLGRSLTDLISTMEHLHSCGVDLFLSQQQIDTTTPMGKLVFHITGAFAQFEREMIRERVKAGMIRARSQGKRLGRMPVSLARENRVRALLAQGIGICKTAKLAKVGTSVVQRIKQEGAQA